MGYIHADDYCRKCGIQLNVDECGNDECDACAFERKPWECEDWYLEDEDE